jgi:uncharacterized protein
MHKRFLSMTDIQAQLLEISRNLYANTWRPDYIVGLSRGGLTPAVMLSQYLKIPMETLKVQLCDGNCETNCWMPEDLSESKKILIIDDINDTGNTIAWIKKDWYASTAGMWTQAEFDAVWASQVRIAVLVNNLSSNQSVDFFGTEINKAEDDAWIVFPWEAWWMTPEIA